MQTTERQKHAYLRMPHRGCRAKETGMTVTIGATTGTVNTSADEATHFGRKNEESLGTTHGIKTNYCNLGRAMEVMQKLQPVQDEACKVFEEIEG
jgi:hypothetical protein